MENAASRRLVKKWNKKNPKKTKYEIFSRCSIYIRLGAKVQPKHLSHCSVLLKCTGVFYHFNRFWLNFELFLLAKQQQHGQFFLFSGVTEAAPRVDSPLTNKSTTTDLLVYEVIRKNLSKWVLGPSMCVWHVMTRETTVSTSVSICLSWLLHCKYVFIFSRYLSVRWPNPMQSSIC